jgi:hypothetical protein
MAVCGVMEVDCSCRAPHWPSTSCSRTSPWLHSLLLPLDVVNECLHGLGLRAFELCLVARNVFHHGLPELLGVVLQRRVVDLLLGLLHTGHRVLDYLLRNTLELLELLGQLERALVVDLRVKTNLGHFGAVGHVAAEHARARGAVDTWEDSGEQHGLPRKTNHGCS